MIASTVLKATFITNILVCVSLAMNHVIKHAMVEAQVVVLDVLKAIISIDTIFSITLFDVKNALKVATNVINKKMKPLFARSAHLDLH